MNGNVTENNPRTRGSKLRSECSSKVKYADATESKQQDATFHKNDALEGTLEVVQFLHRLICIKSPASPNENRLYGHAVFHVLHSFWEVPD